MQSENLEKLKSKLQKASKEKNKAKRGVRIAAVIAEALRSIGQDPVLVGGVAVEFYTEGGYATADIDMLAPGGSALSQILKELGFERRGKDYLNEELEIYIEFPGDFLEEGRKSNLLNVDGIPLKIISVEDLIVDRLCAYKYWKSEIDGFSALLLLELEEIDEKRLQERAKNEDVVGALEWIQKLYEEIFRKKLSPKESSQKLKEWLGRG